MTLTAILLVLISAFMHAGWNFFGKQAQPTLAFFFLTMLLGSLLFSPLIVWQWSLIQAFDLRILGLLLLTGLFQALYLWGLAEAYRAGDMSIAYPIARSSPLIIVCVSSWFLGQGSSISNQSIAGVILIVLGCLLIPLPRLQDFSWRNYNNRTTVFALIAAFATAGYSLVDDRATQLMRELTTPDGTFISPPEHIAILYVTLQSCFSLIWMVWFVWLSKPQRQQFKDMTRRQWRLAAITAVLMLCTYSLVILAMAFVSNVSYVVAFRQLSIPLGVLFAVIGFGESFKLPKLIGVGITFTGLIAVVLG
ncbi:EamA family transporter [Marinomonas sp. FW-1]|uniref:EamA family transporter n=1 Tax=Marinomonas sp. FW-1 TaxID=2071621 RepID=UPI0010BFEAA2|nr:EamA family transporter [Marinomonas sp. FW-1]